MMKHCTRASAFGEVLDLLDSLDPLDRVDQATDPT
jgi:hypothetical protein